MSARIPRRPLLALMASSAFALALNARAQTGFPSRSIKIVVPVPPGFSTDTIARHLAQRLGSKLKSTVIVENRAGGAGGSIGAEAVANSPADGYTLLFAAPGPLVVNKLLYRKIGYDPAQLVPLSIVAAVNLVLVTKPDSPFKTVRELVAHAKANPGKLNYATGGSGTTPHLAMEMLKSQAGVDLTHVAYRGGAAAANGFMQGQIDAMFVELPATLPHIQAGRMRALAVGGKRRVQSLPDVPTVAETFPQFDVSVWYGIVAPPQTPPDIAEKLSEAIGEIMRAPEFVTLLQGMEAVAIGSSQQEYKRFTQEETERWSTVIRNAKISID